MNCYLTRVKFRVPVGLLFIIMVSTNISSDLNSTTHFQDALSAFEMSLYPTPSALLLDVNQCAARQSIYYLNIIVKYQKN
jgi:hypothetical protein